MKYIDLHSHSSASDGTDSPTELIAHAKEAGLVAIALTDHDTTVGLSEASTAALGAGIEFIRGCEISTATDKGNMHMLGLWLPEDCAPLEAFLEHLRGERSKRNEIMIARLQAAGLNITMEEVAAHAKGSVGRPHMAAILRDKGYVQSSDEAFEKWLGINGKAYVPKIAPRPEQALRILKDLGATTILAHPLLRVRPEGWLDKFVSELATQGLDGLEAWHSHQDDAQTAEIIDLARKYALSLSGGSDYHGANKPGIQLGTGKGNLHIGIDVLDKLKARRREKGLPC